jgi:hypothetical protein
MENPEALVEQVDGSLRVTVCNSMSIASGVQYENYKPFYSIQELLPAGSDVEAVIASRKAQLSSVIEDDYKRFHNCRSNDKAIEGHRIEVINGVRYPSVTTVLNPVQPSIPFIEEHAMIGTAMDKCMKGYIDTGLMTLGEDVNTPNVKEGWKSVFNSLSNNIDNLSKFKWIEHSQKVYNHDFIYHGEYDAHAEYEGMNVLVDFKKTKNIKGAIKNKYFMQLAAYSKCLDDIDAIIIINPYAEPIIETNIDKYFGMFLIERGVYKERFGV